MEWNNMNFMLFPSVCGFKTLRQKSSHLVIVLLCAIVTVQSLTLPPPDNTLFLRLMNGGRTAGRVEVYFNGAWGTVCDDGWDDFDATVVCRQLGFRSGQAWDAAYYGKGSGDIVLRNVACDGQEKELSECSLPLGKGDFSASCSHSEDAGVQCFDGDIDVRPIRLQGGNSSAGRVEVFNAGEWGTVCDAGWDDADAAVVCRALGRAGGEAVMGGTYGPGSSKVWLNESACAGTENALTECPGNTYAEQTTGDCATHARDAGVVCGAAVPTLRLAGSTSTSGRVEVLHNGQWGTICDNGWDYKDAKVACRQLGLTGGNARYSALYGQGSGPIWMTDLACSGNEDALTSPSCMSSFGWADYSDICTHGQDASVDCGQPANTEVPSNTGSIIGTGQGSGGTVTATFISEGDVRLTGSPPVGALVELYSGSTWGSLCGQGWNTEAGKVVCQQAGYLNVAYVGRGTAFGQGSTVANISLMSCTGEEASLLDCETTPWSEGETCSHSNDSWVMCTSGRFTEGTVELVGSSSGARRIRVFRYNEWNFVCSGNTWDKNAANVVCRETSGENAVATYQTAAFTNGASHLRSVTCTGNEAGLGDCRMSLMKRGLCPEYVTIVCSPSAAFSTSPSTNIVAIIVPVAILLLIAFIVIPLVAFKVKTLKRGAIDVKPDPRPKVEEVFVDDEVKEPEPTLKDTNLPEKKPLPSVELKSIKEHDDPMSRQSRYNRQPGDLLDRPRPGRLLPALGTPGDRLGKTLLLEDGARSLPPLVGGLSLPPLKPRAGKISSGIPLVFTPRSEGSTMSPRAAWREPDGGVPPPATYDELDLEKPKSKKKKRRGEGIMKKRTSISDL